MWLKRQTLTNRTHSVHIVAALSTGHPLMCVYVCYVRMCGFFSFIGMCMCVCICWCMHDVCVGVYVCVSWWWCVCVLVYVCVRVYVSTRIIGLVFTMRSTDINNMLYILTHIHTYVYI